MMLGLAGLGLLQRPMPGVTFGPGSGVTSVEPRRRPVATPTIIDNPPQDDGDTTLTPTHSLPTPIMGHPPSTTNFQLTVPPATSTPPAAAIHAVAGCEGFGQKPDAAGACSFDLVTALAGIFQAPAALAIQFSPALVETIGPNLFSGAVWAGAAYLLFFRGRK